MFAAFIWEIIASLVARNPRLVDWIIRRAQRTPYYPITSKDGADIYMGRWWLFNPYGKAADGEQTAARWAWLPSIRIHHIMRADNDRHLHDHPWNARTIVLRGWYEEERPGDIFNQGDRYREQRDDLGGWLLPREVFDRRAGYTGRLLFGQYHRISAVPEDGVWTMFFTWKKRGSWGFSVDGKKVSWREYLGISPRS